MASFLLTVGIELRGNVRNGSVVTFVFAGGEAAEQARRAWINGSAVANVRQLNSAHRTLLDLVHER